MKTKTKDQQQDQTAPSNAFISVLTGHANGASCQELTEGMQECIDAVQITGKPATMTMKIKFMASGRGGAFIVAADVSTKLPPLQQETSIWFADDDNTLHREDPKQKQLPLRTLPESQPVRQIS